MALTELTKVTGPGIHTLSNVLSHNIKSSGIITATKFSGPLDSIGGNFAGVITATNGVFSGNVSIGGTLTYEDVTNIDSVGIITAQKDIHVGAGVSAVGVGTFSGLDISGDIDVDGHTNLDNVSVAGVTTFSGGVTVNASLDLNGDIDVDGHTNLDNVNIAGVTTISNDLYIKSSLPKIYLTDTNHDSDWYISNSDGTIIFYDETTTNTRFEINPGGSSDLPRPFIRTPFNTDSVFRGHTILGGHAASPNHTLTVAGISTFNGNINVNADLDVDGHTNLDNVSIAGVTTHSDNVSFTTANGNGIIISKSSNYMMFGNSVTQYFGGSAMWLMHNGSTGYLHNVTGGLYIRNEANNGHIYIQGKSGANSIIARYEGTTELYYNGTIKFNTASTGATVHGTSDPNLTIRQGGSSSSGSGFLAYENVDGNGTPRSIAKIEGKTSGNGGYGELHFQTAFNNTLSTRWTIDHSGHILPGAAGSYNIGSATAEIGDVYLANSKGLKLGNSQVGDLYNDGTDTYFRNSVSNGQTLIRSGGNIWISDYSGNHRAAFRDNSSVDLYFDIENNATAKLSTTVKGISVHGEVAASQDYPNIQPTLDLNFAAVKKLDPRITFYRTTTGSYIDENGDYRWASANEPRFDHDEVTHESKGLLMEVARTNKLSSGNNIDYNANSGGSPGPSLVANNVEAPDGSFTARTIDYTNALASNANSANSEYGWGDSAPAGKTYSASVWVKGIQGQTINMYLDASGQGSGNLNEAKITRTLTGKWQRMSVYYTYPVGANAAVLRIGPRNLHSLGQGTSTVVSMWGVTVVEESRPGSTIATPIVATTTAADYALIDGEEFSEFYSPLEHTTVMIGKRAANVAGSDGRLYTISDGSSSQVAPDWDFDDGTKLRFSTNVGGSSQTVQTINPWSGINDEFKIAAGIALNNQIGVVNGTAIAAADTSCAIPTGVDRLYFGLRGDGGNQGSLTIKRFMFYPKRLPDSQLVTLTS